MFFSRSVHNNQTLFYFYVHLIDEKNASLQL